jgi:hypothetical protein
MKKILLIVMCIFASAGVFAATGIKSTGKVKTSKKAIIRIARTVGTWCGKTITVYCPDSGCTFSAQDIALINQLVCGGQGPQN